MAFDAELFVESLLDESRLLIDIYWNGLKIDVKSSNLVKRNGRNIKWWEFTLRKSISSLQKNTADLFACVGYLNSKVKKVFLIPCEMAPKTWLRLNPKGGSSYNKFTIYEEY